MKPDIDKIKAGLRHCMEPQLCDGCPYMVRPSGQQACGMHTEALKLIDWYEAQIIARDAILDEVQKLVDELREATGA